VGEEGPRDGWPLSLLSFVNGQVRREKSLSHGHCYCFLESWFCIVLRGQRRAIVSFVCYCFVRLVLLFLKSHLLLFSELFYLIERFCFILSL
jgi:hypothetical protein